MTPSDGELLQAYVTRRSEAAFAALVERHIAVVYAVARRAAGQALAEDVTQAVFIVLARKAPSLLNVRTLGGWLHRVTRFAAAEALRKKLRRAKHEHRAAQGSSEADIGSDEINVAAAARVDEALALLATADREVLILRFYQEASFAEIGVALGISEEAARKRTHRALARMKKLLRRSAAMLAAIPLLIGSRLARAIPPAPPGLAQAVAAQAAGRAGLAGKTATLATGVQTMMLLQKLKMTVAALTLATVSVIAGWRVGVYVPAPGIAAPAAGEPQQSPGPQLDEGMLDQCFPVNCQPAPALPWNLWLETPATPQTEPPVKEDGSIDWSFIRC